MALLAVKMLRLLVRFEAWLFTEPPHQLAPKPRYRRTGTI